MEGEREEHPARQIDRQTDGQKDSWTVLPPSLPSSTISQGVCLSRCLSTAFPTAFPPVFPAPSLLLLHATWHNMLLCLMSGPCLYIHIPSIAACHLSFVLLFIVCVLLLFPPPAFLAVYLCASIFGNGVKIIWIVICLGLRPRPVKVKLLVRGEQKKGEEKG